MTDKISIQVHLDEDGVARATFKGGENYKKVFFVELTRDEIQDLVDTMEA